MSSTCGPTTIPARISTTTTGMRTERGMSTRSGAAAAIAAITKSARKSACIELRRIRSAQPRTTRRWPARGLPNLDDHRLPRSRRPTYTGHQRIVCFSRSGCSVFRPAEDRLADQREPGHAPARDGVGTRLPLTSPLKTSGGALHARTGGAAAKHSSAATPERHRQPDRTGLRAWVVRRCLGGRGLELGADLVRLGVASELGELSGHHR